MERIGRIVLVVPGRTHDCTLLPMRAKVTRDAKTSTGRGKEGLRIKKK
jgi:hypothetical protein